MVTRDSKQEAMIFTGWGIRSDISKKCKYQITNTNKKVYKYKTLGSRRKIEEAPPDRESSHIKVQNTKIPKLQIQIKKTKYKTMGSSRKIEEASLDGESSHILVQRQIPK